MVFTLSFIRNDNHRGHLCYASKFAVIIIRVRACQGCKVPLPLCHDCQRSEVPLLHYRSARISDDLNFRICTSARTSKDLKFCIRTSAWTGILKIWFRFRTSALPRLPKCEVRHFRSVLIVKDLRFRFRTSILP